jgi:C1A family cysteine protease
MSDFAFQFYAIPLVMRAVSILCLICTTAVALVDKPRAALRTRGSTETEQRQITWPESLSLSYRMSLPLTSKYQDEVDYVVHYIRREEENGALRVKVVNGANTNIFVEDAAQKTEYFVHPRMNELVCERLVGISEGIDVGVPLPDLAGWEQLGTGWVGEVEATIFERIVETGGRRMENRFYVSAGDDIRPLRLHMVGRDIFSGAHYDEYVLEYLSYSADTPGMHEFDVPASICKSEQAVTDGTRVASRRAQFQELIPKLPEPVSVSQARREGRFEAYEKFQLVYPRHHRSAKDFEARAKLFEENRAMIEQHNANPNVTYTMSINRFADMHIDEIAAILFPRREKPVADEGWGEYEIPYEPLSNPAAVPKAVDWRGTDVGGIVKDQAICGSCWAFAATGTIESAWNKKHPEAPVKLSEQQVTDCSWKMQSNACAGGFPNGGIAAAAQQGISFNSGYPYLGKDDFCRSDLVPEDESLRVKGYARVPAHDDNALMEAIYSRGAIAVSIDATNAFAFYKDGVLQDTTCKTERELLNHAVLAVGYGTDENTGVDYWLIKNSWGDLWGDHGHVRVARTKKACGITADPVYAIV